MRRTVHVPGVYVPIGPRLGLLLVSIVFASNASAAQRDPTNRDRPTVQAVRLGSQEEITLDGLLDEDVWASANPATDFKQLDPLNGEAATERTEIRIVYDDNNLYIGAELFDSDSDGLLANQMVRDGSLASDDRFMWVLDPLNDRRSGYYFEVNPAGAMGDAQLVPGLAGRFGTNEDREWDGIWTARVRPHGAGWTIEVEIPFSTINFDPQAEVWGANFQRTVRRKNEEDFWSGWGRSEGLFNLTSAGAIVGIRDISQGLALQVQPYLIGNYNAGVREGTGANYSADAGLDVFYKLTPRLQANLTINTDFAQTEVDNRQINLTRFPLFFPEKRDFFLEGAGNFDFGREPSGDLTAFFSRRIGIANGRPQKIDYGVKVVGQVAGLNLGLMQVRTAAEPGAAGEDLTVVRPKRQFFTQSYAGLIYTRRAARNSTTPDRHTVGADLQLATAQFRSNKNLQFNLYYLKTPNGVVSDNDAAYGLRLVFANQPLGARIWFRNVEKNFEPALGFTGRKDYRRLQPVVSYVPQFESHPWIRSLDMQAYAGLITDTHGRWAERQLPQARLTVNFHSGDQINLLMTRRTYERLQRDFQITPAIVLQAGNEYAYTRSTVGFTTASRRALSGDASVTLGSFYSGTRRDIVLGLNIRPRNGIVAALGSSFSRVELEEGSFSTRILSAVVDTQFNPLVSVSNNVQYDTVSRTLGWQFRFRWILMPGNDIYLVWVNNWLDTGEAFTTVDRRAAAKVVYSHRF